MIKSIKIDRFKSLHHTPELQLGGVTLLTGANGNGKSSFCQVLLTLSQSWRRGMMDNLLPNGIWKELGTFNDVVCSFDEDKTIDIKIKTDAERDNDFELIYGQNSENVTLGELQSVKVGGRPITDEEMGDDSDDGVEPYEEDGQDTEIRLGSIRDYPSLLALERMYYVAAERRAAPASQPIDETTPHNYIAPDGSNTLNVLWKNRNRNCIAEVQHLLEQVLDSGRFELTEVGENLVLKINSVDDGNYYQPINVGYGYSYILSLLAAIVLAPEGSFIIAENPEAHLHPSAQAKMMNVLIEASTQRHIQLIVETHSDHVLNTALRSVNEHRITPDNLKILFFSRKQNADGQYEAGVQNLNVNQLGHILNPPKQFFEQYSQDLRALYAPPARQEAAR